MFIFDAGGSARLTTYSYDLAVFIGRFAAPHDGHGAVIEAAKAQAERVLLLKGSHGAPRTYYVPFTSDERSQMIEGAYGDDRVIVRGLPDWTYNNARWVAQVQSIVDAVREELGLPENARIALIGHAKDHTSYYLKMFPQWGSIEVANYKSISATPYREAFFLQDDWANFSPKDGLSFHEAYNPSTIDFLYEFRRTEAFAEVQDEYAYIREYRKPYAHLPYGIIFQTVDSVITQSGHILLVKRRARPGKGLWALPGGFLNQHEAIEDAAYRELREETKIKVPEAVLRGSTTDRRRFDDPNRSARGRVITDTFRIELPDATELPKVKGADDALKAKWIPLAKVRRDMMFEDHYHIISVTTGAF